MGVFSNTAITDRGRILLADVNAGNGIFEATRIVMGSGKMPSGLSPHNMTGVVNQVISLPINKIVRSGDGKVLFGGVYTNTDIAEAFYFREFALYARIKNVNEGGEFDGTYGEEVLYCYGNSRDTADLMPSYTSGSVVEKQMNLVTWIGNDAQISLELQSGLYLTAENIEMYLEEYAKKGWVKNRIDEKFEIVVVPLIGDVAALVKQFEAVNDRLTTAEADLVAVNNEILALQAKDLQIHSTVNEFSAMVNTVWDAVFNDIIENPTIVDFDTLDGITLTGGVWNATLRRLEV